MCDEMSVAKNLVYKFELQAKFLLFKNPSQDADLI
jgi:hypothetical protein